MAAGAEHGITPYGTEALHVMRAEKGFIMIGDETDGTVIPQDLGLHWAISKKKEDFLGKRAQERHAHDRPRALASWWGSRRSTARSCPTAPMPGRGVNANGQRNTKGRVTSTYYSPTLGKGIAMGLVLHGPDRMGEVIVFNTTRKIVKGRSRRRSPRASSARSSMTPRGRSRMSEFAVSALSGARPRASWRSARWAFRAW
jgi:sarcosine oxidase subunit alpha